MHERVEGLLYSDVEFEGSDPESDRPYRLLNAFAPWGAFGPKVVARVEYHIFPVFDPNDLKTRDAAYHGGDIFDELASLVSLALGVRCRSGGMTRTWGLGENHEELGVPIMFDHSVPYLPTRPSGGSVLIAHPRSVNLETVYRRLERFADLAQDEAAALVRAARLYQQAVWVADDDASQSWLQLVSAVETASSHWAGPKTSAEERLRSAWPELAEALDTHNATAGAAPLLSGVVRSTARFLAFMSAFAPPPPATRPPPYARADWDRLEDALRTIYNYRSRALHDGRPFPYPMCQAPRTHETIPVERPDGEGAWARGSSWIKDDLPMLLSTFEYLARGALLNWWDHLENSQAT
jgi:hypothetical protein